MTRNVAAVVTVLMLLNGCTSGGGPTQDDLLPEAGLTYPAAVETSRTWSEEDHDRSIDGMDLSNNARLTRRFRLEAPVQTGEILAWYQRELEDRGWTAPVPAGTDILLAKVVGDRTHNYRIAAGSGFVGKFTTYYTIGFKGERPSFLDS